MPELPVFGDQQGGRAIRMAYSQALEFKAKIDGVWR